MSLDLWLALVALFGIGGLTPGPAVMLVLASSFRYGFKPAMLPALGIASANVFWLILAASGAAVTICPTNVTPDDPRSYYSIAERLNKEIPNSFWCNQYDNKSNALAHYEGTGPEIWEQTEGKITHFVVGVGTGGTISGVGKFDRSITDL